jgi:hypothetical protein
MEFIQAINNLDTPVFVTPVSILSTTSIFASLVTNTNPIGDYRF